MFRRGNSDDSDSDEPKDRRHRSQRKSAVREMAASTPNTRRKKRPRWSIGLLLLGLLLFFLPNLVGWLGLHQRLIDYGLSDFNGVVTAKYASLGWFQPIELTEISGTDVNGNPILQIDRIDSSRTLLSLLTSTNYGEFNFIKPVVYLDSRPDGSNLEDAIANYLASNPDIQDRAALPKFKLNFYDGQIQVVSAHSKESWQIDSLNLVVQLSADQAPLKIEAQCDIRSTTVTTAEQAGAPTTGHFKFAGQVDSGSPTLDFEMADFLLETQAFPLSLAGPVLERLVGTSSAEGILSGKIKGQYNAKTQSLTLDADRFNITGLGILSPGLFGSDRISVASATAQGDLQLTSTLVSARQFHLQSDFGWIKADGNFDINQVVNLATRGELLDTPFKMDGEIDLARLIRMLPATLQLHNDLVVQSGTVSFQASSRIKNGNRRLVVNLDTANLGARRGDRTILWAKPFRLVGTLQESDGRLAIDSLECLSEFLTIRGSASRQTASFVVNGDVSKLMERVGQFVDLQGARLEGIFDGQLGWKVSSAASLRADPNGPSSIPMQLAGHFEITNPVIQIPNRPVWQQPQLSVTMTAAGIRSMDQMLQIDEGMVEVEIGSERVMVELAESVSDALAQTIWNLRYQITGSMAAWSGHIGNFVDLSDIATAGELRLTGDATLGPTLIQSSNIQYEIEKLEFDGFGLVIREPKTTGSGSVIYNIDTNAIKIPDAVLSGSAISVRCQPLNIALDDSVRVDGNIAFRADVSRISEWIDLSPTPESLFWFGSMEGTVQLVSTESGIGSRINSTISNLVAARQVTVPAQRNQTGQFMTISQPTRIWKEVLREPKVVLGGDVSFESEDASLRFQNMLLRSAGVIVKADGTLSDLGGAMELDFSGTWNPSWDMMNKALADTTGKIMRFEGNRDQAFRIHGPIFQTPIASGASGLPTPWVPPELLAMVGFGWDRGEILSLPIGQSQIQLDIQQSVAIVRIAGVPFSGGEVNLTPRIELRGSDPVMTLNRTRVIDHVELRQETARGWLRFVTPFLADATSAHGTFTVDIDEARIPIFDFLKMKASGSVQLSDVAVGAGPVTEQLLVSVNLIRKFFKPRNTQQDVKVGLRLADQTVPVIVQSGRIYHKNLELSHNDIVIRTSGSVGFDQSIDLVAQIAIADDWIAGRPLMAGLRGRSISIPITGSISDPKLDLRALHDFTANMARQAVGSAFQNEFNQELNREINKIRDKLFGK